MLSVKGDSSGLLTKPKSISQSRKLRGIEYIGGSESVFSPWTEGIVTCYWK